MENEECLETAWLNAKADEYNALLGDTVLPFSPSATMSLLMVFCDTLSVAGVLYNLEEEDQDDSQERAMAQHFFNFWATIHAPFFEKSECGERYVELVKFAVRYHLDRKQHIAKDAADNE